MRQAKLTDEAIELWGTKLYSMQMIGDRFRVTRQAVKKYLNRRGVKTDKSQSWASVPCSQCGDSITRTRSKRRNVRKAYCSPRCYFKALYNPHYRQSRMGQRRARDVIRSVYLLDDGHVVHHEDSDTSNNNINNLMVFNSQSDHMRWHRLGGIESGVTPLWP